MRVRLGTAVALIVVFTGLCLSRLKNRIVHHERRQLVWTGRATTGCACDGVGPLTGYHLPQDINTRGEFLYN